MPHIHDKIDFTVETFIVNKDKVLLRMHDKYHFWCSVGGHIELNENPNEAAIREVKEEVGLSIELYNDENIANFNQQGFKELVRPQFLNIHDINENHKHISLVYFAKSDKTDITESQNELSGGCKWFTSEELDSKEYDIRPSIKYYAKCALLKLSKGN